MNYDIKYMDNSLKGSNARASEISFFRMYVNNFG